MNRGKRNSQFWSRCPTHRGRRSFTLVELMVTVAIMGLLLTSVLPMLGRFGRNNSVIMASQTIRESLAELQSYAIANDPSLCVPSFGKIAFTYPINNYALFIPPSGGGTTPNFDFEVDAGTYECGVSQAAQTLSGNQFAVLARNIQYGTNGTISKEFIVGIIRLGNIEDPAQFASPISGVTGRPIMIGYQVPSGDYVGNSKSGVAGYDYLPIGGQVINSTAGEYLAEDSINGLFSLVGLSSPDGYRVTMFINRVTGQITSTGIVPQGFTKR